MNFEKAADFIWNNGRLLERRIFEYVFLRGTENNIRIAIKAYQNEDGGFGHAIEPDLRTPESQPVSIEFALRTLYDCKIKDTEVASKVCDYLSHHADVTTGIPAIFRSSSYFPRATHWNNPQSEVPSCSRLTGLVGLLKWQGVEHSWLDEVTDRCLSNISYQEHNDSHTILTAYYLLESLPQTNYIKELYDKLSQELFQANFFCLEVPSQSYGLTPLEFAPTLSSYCGPIFSEKTIIAHLKVLESQQDEDGGWPIQWDPPGVLAKLEWRAYKTLKSLMTLNSYNMLKT